MARETILEGPFAFWTSVNLAARREAMLSPLPGYFDGPADAYRHIMGTAELRRRFGFATAYGIVTGNEIYGTHWAEAPHEMRRMDDHNNAIGLEIGATARTYEEVVRRARAAVDEGIARGGDGSDGTAQWLPASRWGEPRGRPVAERSLSFDWPAEIPSLPGYRFGDARFGTLGPNQTMTPRQREAATLDRLRELPTSEWSEEDVRAVIRSGAYGNSAAAGHRDWRARVRRYFEEREGAGRTGEATPSEERDCTGVAAVRAHTRAGPSGPVQVSAHSRAVACG